MVQPDEQQQKETLPLSESRLVLRDATLVASEMVLDTVALPAKLNTNDTKSKPGSYTVEIFWDEALVTSTDLLYGKTAYPLENIDSLQILKLHRRRSVIQKKLSNFLACLVAAFGLVLLFSSLAWSVHILGLLLALSSMSYAVYFNWWVEQRRRGEFGLLMTMKLDSKVVITSHSLKAIQTLYQIMFRRLDGVNPAAESLMVNMYTGETMTN